MASRVDELLSVVGSLVAGGSLAVRLLSRLVAERGGGWVGVGREGMPRDPLGRPEIGKNHENAKMIIY